jgi:anti-anti-sigma regulatory factor
MSIRTYPKSRAGVRTIPLPDFLVCEFAAHREESAGTRRRTRRGRLAVPRPAAFLRLRDLDTTDRSAVQVQSLGEQFPTDAVMEPVAQVQAYAAATEQALAAGFAGLRVAVEATPLVRTPHQLDAAARCEHLVDRYMIGQPLSALCAYNRVELGEETVAQLACLHPRVNQGAPLFRLYASTYAAASLSGELDATSDRLFPTALRWADLRPTAGELVIDASELTFIDHRSLLSLADHARAWDATAVLLGNLLSAAKLIDILDLTEVRIDPRRRHPAAAGVPTRPTTV